MKYISRRAIIYTLTLLIIIITVLLTLLRSSDVSEYITAPVRKGDVENSVLATGRIDTIERINVGAQVSGQLKPLKVKQGDHVTKGQLIAEVDDLPQCNGLRNAEAALNEVRTELQFKQALLKQAELRFKCQLRMLRENASSHEDFESAEAMLAATRAELLSLNAKLVQTQIKVNKKKLAFEYTRVVAPMDRIVIAIVTQQGQTVNSDQSAPTTIKLARLDVMTIKAQTPEADITRISVGQRARFPIFSEPGKHYSAALRAVELAPESVMEDDSLASNTLVPGSGTSNASVYYNVLFDVPNPEDRLHIAVTAQVTLITDEAQNTLLVPIQVMHRNEGKKQQVLVLVADGRLGPRNVKIGITSSVDIQILGGLNIGENAALSLPDKKGPEERIML